MIMPDYPVLIEQGQVIDVSNHGQKVGLRIPTYMSDDLVSHLIGIPIRARTRSVDLAPEHETVALQESADISNTIISDVLLGVAGAMLQAAQDASRRHDVVLELSFEPEYLTEPLELMCAGGPWGHHNTPMLVVTMKSERHLLPVD